MAFNFSRIKNWLGYENITSQDLNIEFNNIVQKAGADTLSSANSTNGTAPTVAAMQTQLSPGGLSTEVLALTTQQDIQQLRYQLAAITGNPFWYESPASTILAINNELLSLFTVPTSRIVSGRVDGNGEPMFLTPAGVADSITLKATATDFIAYTNGVERIYTADITLSGITLATAIANTALVNDATLVGQESSASQGEYGTFLNIDTIGASIAVLDGRYAAFLIGTEYFIAEVDIANSRLKNAIRGAGFNQTDTWNARAVISDNDTITLMNLAWVFATYNGGIPGIDAIYNKPVIAVVQPATPSIGDYWYDVVNQTWKKYNGVTFAGVEAVMIGYAIVDTANVKIGRSFDFFKPYNQLNTIEVEFLSTTQVRANRIGAEISVYGITYPFQTTQPIWNVTTTLDSGVVLTANFTYYCYVTNTGDLKTSDISPRERKFDLLGQYHPAKPWRCVGSFATDAGSLITSSGVSFSLYHQSVLPDLLFQGTNISNSIPGSALKDLGVTNAKLNTMPAVSVKANSTIVASAATDLNAVSNGQVLMRVTNTLIFSTLVPANFSPNSVVTVAILDEAVTIPKLSPTVSTAGSGSTGSTTLSSNTVPQVTAGPVTIQNNAREKELGSWPLPTMPMSHLTTRP